VGALFSLRRLALDAGRKVFSGPCTSWIEALLPQHGRPPCRPLSSCFSSTYRRDAESRARAARAASATNLLIFSSRLPLTVGGHCAPRKIPTGCADSQASRLRLNSVRVQQWEWFWSHHGRQGRWRCLTTMTISKFINHLHRTLLETSVHDAATAARSGGLRPSSVAVFTEALDNASSSFMSWGDNPCGQLGSDCCSSPRRKAGQVPPPRTPSIVDELATLHEGNPISRRLAAAYDVPHFCMRQHTLHKLHRLPHSRGQLPYGNGDSHSGHSLSRDFADYYSR